MLLKALKFQPGRGKKITAQIRDDGGDQDPDRIHRRRDGASLVRRTADTRRVWGGRVHGPQPLNWPRRK